MDTNLNGLELILFLSNLEQEFFNRLEDGLDRNEIKDRWAEAKTATLEALTK